METKPVYVVSDIHLGAVPAATEAAFRDFLRSLEGRAAALVVNGDLFDFWFEYRTVIHSRHYRVLATLAELVESGVRVYFMGGNHDAWGGDFLRSDVGIEVLEEGAELELAGRRALIVHGDGVGKGDLGYRALKRFIRHPFVVAAFRILHPDFGSRIAGVVSTTEGKQGNGDGASPGRAAELQEWAVEQLDARQELDLVLAGHTHTPTIHEHTPGRYYVNTGDWINHRTYLKLTREQPPVLLTWGAEGVGAGPATLSP